MVTNNRYIHEFAIDPIDILKQLCRQWKVVILFSLIVALLVTGAKYLKDAKDYKLANNTDGSTESISDEKTDPKQNIDAILDNLTESDRLAVEQTLRLKKTLYEKNEYLNDSILMNLDPYNVKTLTVSFAINDVANDEVLTALSKGYYALFNDPEALSALQACIDKSAEPGFISELILDNRHTQSFEYDGAIQLIILLPDSVDEDTVAEIVKNVINERRKSLATNIAPHNISAPYAEIKRAPNNYLIDQKTSTVNWVYNLQFSLQNTEKILTEPQMTAYTAISAIQTEETTPVTNTLSAPTISKKYLLLGFICGIIVYIAVLVFINAFSPKVRSAAFVEHITKTRLLGNIQIKHEEKDLFSFMTNNSIITNSLYKRKKDAAILCDEVVDRLKAICLHNNCDSVTFFNFSDNNTAVTSCVRHIVDDFASSVDSVKVVPVQCGFSEAELEKYDNIIIVTDDRTSATRLLEIMNLFNYYKKNLIGTIFFEEI